MKKVFLLTAIAGLFAFSSVKAQKDVAMTGPKLGIGAEFAFPMGDFGDVYNLGFGGSLLYQHPVAANLNLTGSAGYTTFTGKKYEAGGVTIKAKDAGFIPVKAGARYFVAENFYIGGELGAAFSTADGGKTAFAYAPGIGIEFPVSDGGAIELGGRYEGWSANSTTSSFIEVRLPYNLGL